MDQAEGTQSDVKVLLITGAGASAKLGQDEDLPMMPGLSRALYQALNAEQAGIASAILLEEEMSGPEFEKALGLLFRWRDSRSLNSRFSSLGHPTPSGPQIRSSHQQKQWKFEAQHLESILRIVDETLLAVFGSDKIDPSKAKAAYGWLFDQLGGLGKFQLMCATTNYDPSLEMALRMLGASPDLGFRGEEWETKTLSADKIEPWVRPALLHLHGAVGWYREEDGSVVGHPKDRGLNESLGRPAVLYPDPDKDPAEGATRDLWQVLRGDTVGEATHVLVLGHSLHDPPLLRLIQDANARPGIRVGVVVRSDRRGRSNQFNVVDTALQRLVEEQLPDATMIRGTFVAPTPMIAQIDLKTWLG